MPACLRTILLDRQKRTTLKSSVKIAVLVDVSWCFDRIALERIRTKYERKASNIVTSFCWRSCLWIGDGRSWNKCRRFSSRVVRGWNICWRISSNRVARSWNKCWRIGDFNWRVCGISRCWRISSNRVARSWNKCWRISRSWNKCRKLSNRDGRGWNICWIRGGAGRSWNICWSFGCNGRIGYFGRIRWRLYRRSRGRIRHGHELLGEFQCLVEEICGITKIPRNILYAFDPLR
mmetsp:Transcript_32019/g.73660  ORF Transcript_32019/g.73660 Transcript_32019/m.73660 type:complete len:234 (+) Transcript_32019:1050-1751(+)